MRLYIGFGNSNSKTIVDAIVFVKKVGLQNKAHRSPRHYRSLKDIDSQK